MVKVRIHEIAKELGIRSKDVIEKAKEIQIDNIKSANSSISGEEAQYLMTFIMGGARSSLKVDLNISSDDILKEEIKVVQIKEVVGEILNNNIQLNETEKENKKELQKKNIKKEKEVNVKKESLAQVASLKNRRRGLVIVKKKQKDDLLIPKLDNQVEATPETLYDKLSTLEVDENLLTKKRKKSKKTPLVKQEAKKIDLEIGAKNFLDISLDDEVEENYMPDITIYEKDEEYDKKSKKLDATTIRSTKKSAFLENTSIQRKKPKKLKKKIREEEKVNYVEIPEEVRVYEFSEKIKKSVSEVISALFKLGVVMTRNDFLDKDSIEILAEEFEIEVHTVNALEGLDELEEIHRNEVEKMKEDGVEGVERPPIITIMGHVDHGKTSLLDKIRSTKVTESEHGGITQHIGAYMIEKNGKKITFLDTPGHEAFSEMRARGTSVTDIVVIVVAADDGVKPQTKEAVDHAKVAKVPIIVAINKMDKPTANPDLVKTQLSDLGLMPVEWGGNTEFVEVSALTGAGIEDLLELILIQSEVLELKSNPDTKDAKAVVIESSITKGRGAVATVIVQNGTLRIGNNVVCGIAYGRIKALINEKGENLKAIHPGEPGIVIGLNEVPHIGESLFKVEDAKQAKELSNQKSEFLRHKELSESKKVTLDELGDKIAEGKLKSLPIILKADVAGSLEAIKGKLLKIKNDEVKVNIISSGIGGISEGDISLAEASENSVILGFNIRPTGLINKRAKDLGIEIKTYNVIYDLEEDVKNILSGLLSPIEREENLGQAEVKQVFRVPKLGAIAGSIVTDGTINKGVNVRVIRDGVIVYEGEISSLKRFKDDVKEVSKGYECGIGVVGYDDIQEGDYLESFKIVKEKATI